jgi:predicted transcriptional regulator
MKRKRGNDWIKQTKIHDILVSFSRPKTPRQVEIGLGIGRFKLKPFVEKGLLESLNPGVTKGRLYFLTNRARKLLQLPACKRECRNEWGLIGWITASPKQRSVILKVMDSAKRTSEEIRQRASKRNPHLSRISTKGILRQLVGKGLIETKMIDKKRYYFINDKGRSVVEDIDYLSTGGQECQAFDEGGLKQI